MAKWKVGDECYVVTDTYHKSEVVKVGRRWLKVKMRGCGAIYEFDLFDKLRDRCCLGTVLMTVEQMELDNTQRSAADMVAKLREFVRRCPDRALLKHIAKCINTWTDPPYPMRYVHLTPDPDGPNCGKPHPLAGQKLDIHKWYEVRADDQPI